MRRLLTAVALMVVVVTAVLLVPGLWIRLPPLASWQAKRVTTAFLDKAALAIATEDPQYVSDVVNEVSLDYVLSTMKELFPYDARPLSAEICKAVVSGEPYAVVRVAALRVLDKYNVFVRLRWDNGWRVYAVLPQPAYLGDEPLLDDFRCGDW